MMAEDKKISFPTIPIASWFTLREKFKQRPPSEVNPSYIASSLAMTVASAGANVLPALKAFGIVGEDGKPTELAYDWRDDSKYKEVCEKIIAKVYPQGLQDLFHDSTASLEDLKSWFMRSAKVGEAAAIKFARTYHMLLKADIEQTKDTTSTNNRKPKSPTTAKVQKESVKAIKKVEQQAVEVKVSDNEKVQMSSSLTPSLHIDIQIHISPESSADQIDKIFESMAKHLKGFKA